MRRSGENPKKRKRTVKRPVSPQQRLKKQENRRSRRRLMIMSAFVLITLALTLFMIRLVLRSTAPQAQLYIVQNGTILSEVYSEGLIGREELVLDATASGMFEPQTNDGAKVRKGDEIGNIIAPSGINHWNQLEEVKLALSQRQLDLLSEDLLDDVMSDYNYTDSKLQPLIDQLRHVNNKGELNQVNPLLSRIQVLIEERNAKILDVESEDPEIQKLLLEKAAIEEQLSAFSTAVTASESGIIAFNPDSLSGSISEEDILTMDVSELEEVLNAKTNTDTRPSREVRLNENLAFLVEDLYQNFVFVLPNRTTVDFPIDRTYDLDLPDEGVTIEDAELIRATEEENKLVLVFRTDTNVESLITKRFVRARIQLESDRGLKVPIEALTFEDAANPTVATIMLVRSGYVHEERVEVRKTDAQYAIISSPIGAELELSQGSVIVQNPNAVKDGDQISG